MRVLPVRRRGAERLLRDALKQANARPAGTGGSPTDVQLLGQVSGSATTGRRFGSIGRAELA